MVQSTQRKKSFLELEFTDDFMFCKVMENNPDLCKELVEIVLGRKISKIVSITSQKFMAITSESHGVRFDVMFEDDEKTVYDIEMQTVDHKELPRRSRYYQTIADIDSLPPGIDYRELPNTCIIFLCTFDPFGLDEAKYTIRPHIEEALDYPYTDGTEKVIIAATGHQGNHSEELKGLLRYMITQEATSDFTRRLSEAILRVKSRKEWGVEYMFLEEKLRREREEGRTEGRVEAQSELIRLYEHLKAQERLEEYDEAMRNPQKLEELKQELL